MPRFDSDGEDDIFFDASDDFRVSRESSSDDCSTSNKGLALRGFEYELWASEPTSVQERRKRFLEGMGFGELLSTGMAFSDCQGEITNEISLNDLEERIISTRSSTASSLGGSFSENGSTPDGAYCIRDLDTGKRFIVHAGSNDGQIGMLREFGSDNMMTLKEFESLIGLSHSVQKFLRREEHGHSPAGEMNGTSNAKKNGFKNLWSFTRKKNADGICQYNVHVKNLKTNRSFRTKVQHQKKKCMDFSAVYMCQEIQAHKGLIRVMKFSPSGWYLASGGEDCVVRIWQIREMETSPKSYGGEVPREYINEIKGLKPKLGKRRSRALAIMPKKAFNISETPLQEFQGHTSDILDMAWSTSDCLLTSSKDMTVRMWKVGGDGCLAVFKHTDYVTCVQFNPVDERYFISGSIDSKVRVWHVLEKRVVYWDDARDIVTALSYQPDGKGFIVGTIAGTCRFYDQSGQDMQLDKLLVVQRKKKSAANQITDLQISRGDSPRIIITSTDSKIRVAEGADITQKFEGPRSSKGVLSPSLTSDGRYLVSAGLDSNVYIWNFDSSDTNTVKGGAKSVSSCELFFSEGVTTAVPWPGLHDGNHIKSSCLPDKTVGKLTPRYDRECCSLGTWFFADSMRGSATWPEEKLPPSSRPVNSSGPDCKSAISAAWNMVIVTASRDGVIRSFHNYGLPVRL